jgi:excisionase family DNA binding protein
MNNEILTVSQAAKLMQISEKLVRKLIKDQRLVATKVGHAWRIRRSDIDFYFTSNSNGKKGAK